MADKKILQRVSDVLHEKRMGFRDLADTLGASPQLISSWRARGIPESRVMEVAKALGVDPDRLLRDSKPELSPAYQSTRTVPVISMEDIGSLRDVINSVAERDRQTFETVDAMTAKNLGPNAFALRIEGTSMAPEYQPGDLIIVDPDEPARPGDVVIARLDIDGSVTLKKYKDRGYAEDGSRIIDLVPTNPDYPVITLSRTHPGKIIGPVIEHRRYPRR